VPDETGRRFVEDGRKQRSPFHYQKHREANADEQRREHGTVDDEQFECESENSFHDRQTFEPRNLSRAFRQR
jgi:hypothetical protein